VCPIQEDGEAVRVTLGRTCIEIGSSDRAFLAWARGAYRPFLTAGAPDFRIDVSIEGERPVAEINALLPELRGNVQGDRFSTQPPLLDGQVDRLQHTLHVRTQRHMFSPGVEYRLMNFLLRAVYYAVYRCRWGMVPDAYLVHGCGILDRGKAYLFTGPSGAGKTTLARLAGHRIVLNDETVLLGRDGAGFTLAGTPFDGGLPARSNARGDLAAVFFLRHDGEVRRSELSQAKAYLGLLAQTLEASALLDPAGTARLDERADFCAALAARVPCFELGFRPDASVWTALEMEEVA
jgi:hypothetical protein